MTQEKKAEREGTGTAQEIALAAHALRAHAGAYGAKLADQLEQATGHAEPEPEEPEPEAEPTARERSLQAELDRLRAQQPPPA